MCAPRGGRGVIVTCGLGGLGLVLWNDSIAHKLPRLIYAMLTHGLEYTDWGQDDFEERYRQRVLHKLAQQAKAKAMGMQLVPSDNPV